VDREGERAVSPLETVRAGYDAIGDRYHAWSRQGETRLRFVREVLDRLRPGSTVVDLGCGPGDPATRLFSQAHAVLGVDISLGQLSIARRLAPRATLVRADIGQLALRPGSVDAVVSFYATGHLPGASHATLFAEISTWLRPGGFLLTSAPLTVGDTELGDWLGVPMFFGGIGADATVVTIKAAGLDIERAETVEEHLDDGSIERFLWVMAARPT
jgi:cyclopropane fatty-acyl-phospholipid synthase-like methyltransferase